MNNNEELMYGLMSDCEMEENIETGIIEDGGVVDMSSVADNAGAAAGAAAGLGAL